MDAEDLKKRTKLFALRILKLAALCLTQSKVERSEVSWFERGPQLAQTIEQAVGRDPAQSLSQRLVSLKKRLTRVGIGSN